MYEDLSFSGISYADLLDRISNFYKNTTNKAAANYFTSIFKEIVANNIRPPDSAKTIDQDFIDITGVVSNR